MREPSVSVSMRGDKDYKTAVQALANQQNVAIADLVRDALDSKYGDELRRLRDFFAASGGSQKNENGDAGTSPAHAS